MLVWDMAEKFGWTLEYIDSLPVARIMEFLQIEDGKGKAFEQTQKRKKGK